MPQLRPLLIALSLLALPTCLVAQKDELPVHADKWSDKYDPHFRKYTKRYFGPHYDWHWFKSQAIAESNLKPKVRSHRGAVGLMQILPSTFAEIQRSNPQFLNLEEPRWNIAAGIYYDRTLYRKWELPADRDRLYLALASYNAGYVRMRRAYNRTPKPVESWEQVKKKAPKETQEYVQRIRALMDRAEPKTKSHLRGFAKVLAEQDSQ